MGKMKIIVYKTKERSKRQWRWRMSVGTKIVADSGEGYHNHADCLRTLRRLIERIYDRRYSLEDEGAAR